MQLTPNFTKQEMEHSSTAIRKGFANVCPPELLPNMQKVAEHLEIIRAHFDAPIHVTSCYRSPAVNKAVGGSKTSAHSFALAADITVQGVPVLEVCEWCAENISDFDQIINEFPESPGGWTHIGFTNKTPRKEIKTAVKRMVAGKLKTVYLPGFTV